MRIMIDTNIIISAILFPKGKAAQAFMKSLMPPNQPMICDYILDEVYRKFQEKFSDRKTELDAFLFHALSIIRVVSVPETEFAVENNIRDPKDRPILRAALNEHADLFLTGDKDFLESSIDDPRIVSVGTFLEMS